MKHIGTTLLLLLSFAVIYGVFSFGYYNINVASWDAEARVIMYLLVVIFWVSIIAAQYSDD